MLRLRAQLVEKSDTLPGTRQFTSLTDLCLIPSKCFVTLHQNRILKKQLAVLSFFPPRIHNVFISNEDIFVHKTNLHRLVAACGAICVLNSRWFMRSCVSNVGLSIYLRLIN